MREPSKPPRKSHFPALTGLRFFLALWVVVHHLSGPGMMLQGLVSALPWWLANVVRGGYHAVGTFFVLSGFVLARSYSLPSWNQASLIRYGVARIARVYPVYLLSLAIVLPFMLESKFALDGVLAVHGFLLQGWSVTWPVHWNTPAWSLSCEIFFYACFPLASPLLRRVNWWTLLLLAAASCFIPTVMRSAGVPLAWKPLINLGDFLIGMLAARALELVQPLMTGRGYFFYVPGFALGGTLIAWPELLGSMTYVNAALRPLNALLLLGLALGGGVAADFLSLRWAVFSGKISYAFYILHIPLLWWFRRLGPSLAGEGPRVALAIAYLVIVIALSAIVFRWVEEPANKFLRARLGP